MRGGVWYRGWWTITAPDTDIALNNFHLRAAAGEIIVTMAQLRHKKLIRALVIQSKISEPLVYFLLLFIHVALIFSLVHSRVLQCRLGGQMDMESKLDTTWQQLSSWRQDTRLRNFQRWALQLDYSWHCTTSVRTSAVHGRYLELLNILLDCNMCVKKLMRNKWGFNVTMHAYVFYGSFSLYVCLFLPSDWKMA